MYKEINPSKMLEEVINCYWIIDGTKIKESHLQKVFPDGCFDIVIDIDANQKANKVILTGIWNKTIKVPLLKDVQSVGVRFYPSAIEQFFNCSVSNLINTVQPFQMTMFKEDTTIDFNNIYSIYDPNEIIDFLDCFFVLLYLKYCNISKVQKTLQQISKVDSNIKIDALANNRSISRRQLSRIYQNRFGISTKTYLSINKFISAKNRLDSYSKTDMNFTDIALDCGYYDQAHFNRAFKKYSGITPSQYVSNQ